MYMSSLVRFMSYFKDIKQLVPLGLFSLISLLLLVFIKIADEVVEGDTNAFDQYVLLSLRNPSRLSDPLGPVWFEEATRDITALGGHSILGLITLMVVIYLVMMRRKDAALLVLVSVLGGMLISSLTKIGFERPRPELVPHLARIYTASFPSGHAMLSAVVYLTLGSLLSFMHEQRRAKIFFLSIALLLTFLVGLSRIYLGVHWPTDVMAGWILGGAWACFCWFVALILRKENRNTLPSMEKGVSSS